MLSAWRIGGERPQAFAVLREPSKEPREMDALITGLDTYAQRLGSFDSAQEAHLEALKQKHRGLLPAYQPL